MNEVIIATDGSAKDDFDNASTTVSKNTPNRSVSLSISRRVQQQKKIDTEKIFKKKIRDIVEGNAVTIIMSIVTLYALIGVSYQSLILTLIVQDDIRLWVPRKPTDPIFFSLMLFCLFLFSFEILINSVVVDEFKYSFFFYLDIIATLSIIFDIPYLLYPLERLIGAPTKPDDINAIVGVLHEASIT